MLRSCGQSGCAERQRGCVTQWSSTRILPSGKRSWSPLASMWRADQVKDNAIHTHRRTHTATQCLQYLPREVCLCTATLDLQTSNSHLRAGYWQDMHKHFLKEECHNDSSVPCLLFETCCGGDSFLSFFVFTLSATLWKSSPFSSQTGKWKPQNKWRTRKTSPL